jgi:hypothetical protein
LERNVNISTHRALTVTASAVAVASLALAGVTVAITTTRPAPAPDTSALETALTRAQTAEQAADALTAQLADADRDARYTACMYALNTLNPGADMTAAAWSCERNLDTFAVLTPGQPWDAREYNER